MNLTNYLKRIRRIKLLFSLILLTVFFFGFEGKMYAALEISGPTLLCTSNSGQYTVNCQCTTTWTCSSNLSLTSGQGTTTATFSATSNGSGWVKARAYYDGAWYEDIYVVWVGPPVVDVITNEGNDWENHLHAFAFWPAYYHISQPVHSLDVNYPGEIWYCYQSFAETYLPGDPYNYYFTLEASNTCGSNYYPFDFFSGY